MEAFYLRAPQFGRDFTVGFARDQIYCQKEDKIEIFQLHNLGLLLKYALDSWVSSHMSYHSELIWKGKISYPEHYPSNIPFNTDAVYYRVPPSLPLQFRLPDVSEGFSGLAALALGLESIIVDSSDLRLMTQIIGQSRPKCQFPKPERFLCSLTYHLSQTEKLWHFSPTPSF